MDDLVRAYFNGVHNCDVIEETFEFLGERRYRVVNEAVDTEEIKRTISQGANKASDPEMTGRDVEKMRKDQRKKISKMTCEEKTKGPRRTILPLSREKDIGKHDDWKDKPLEWGEREEAAKKLRRRAMAVVGTQRRQDKEMNEEVIEYLMKKGYASSVKSALGIYEAMSDEWLENIVEEMTPKGRRDREIAKSGILSRRADELEREIKKVTGGQHNGSLQPTTRRRTKQNFEVR